MTHHFLLYCTLFLSSSLPHFSVLAFLSHNVCRIIHPFCLQRRRHDSIFFAEPIPRPGDRPAPQGGDMAYTKVNIDAQLKRYSDIRNVGGLECITDVYARSSLQPNIYWFTAKVARCTGTVSVEEAVNRQWNLLEEHIVRLRPVELGRSFGSIEFWTAPGDSELACANNELPLQPVKKRSTTVSAKEVGANLEVVTNKGVGFHVERAEDGSILDAFE